MSQAFAITASRIFDGHTFHEDAALLVEDGRVKAVIARADLPAGIARRDMGDALIAPGFIDLQVNGGGGVLFNNDPTVSGIRTICGAHARFGTTALMVTLITDAPEMKREAIGAGEAASKTGARFSRPASRRPASVDRPQGRA